MTTRNQLFLFLSLLLALAGLLYTVSDYPPKTQSQPIPEPLQPKTQPEPSWESYRNEFFGYEIHFPPTFRASPALDEQYGAGIETHPTVEINSPQLGLLLLITVIKNDRDYSPEEWVEATIKQHPQNIIQYEHALSFQGRQAYAIEAAGVYSIRPSTPLAVGSTLGDFYRFLFISDGDRMIRVSFPFLDEKECPKCRVYRDIVSTLTLEP